MLYVTNTDMPESQATPQSPSDVEARIDLMGRPFRHREGSEVPLATKKQAQMTGLPTTGRLSCIVALGLAA